MDSTPKKDLELDVDALLAEPFKELHLDAADAFTPFKLTSLSASPNCSTATPASTWAPTPHDSVWTPSESRWSAPDPMPPALASLDATERFHVCTQLQECAESYAVAKKAHSGDDLDASLRTIYSSLAASLGEEEEEAESADQALRALVSKYVPEFNGEATSIGSLPTVMGRDRDARPCRFFPKGKCFDGVLCRFSHAPECRALHNITNELSKMSPSKGASPTRRGSRGAGSARRKKEGRQEADKHLWALLGAPQHGYGYSAGSLGDRKRLDTRPDKLATLFDALKASGAVAPQRQSAMAAQLPTPQVSAVAAQDWWSAYAQAYNDAATAHAQALIAGLNATSD